MPSEFAFQKLYRRLQKLHDGLLPLKLNARHDSPRRGESKLADDYGEWAEDALDILNRAMTAALEARRALGEQVHAAERALRGLGTCQKLLNDLSALYIGKLAAHEILSELEEFGSKKGDRWEAWVACVTSAIAQCRQPLGDVGKTLLECWRDTVVRVGTHGNENRNTARTAPLLQMEHS